MWKAKRALTPAGRQGAPTVPGREGAWMESFRPNEDLRVENERRGVMVREDRTAWAGREGKKYSVTARQAKGDSAIKHKCHSG